MGRPAFVLPQHCGQEASSAARSAGQTLTPLRSPFRVAVYYPALSRRGRLPAALPSSTPYRVSQLNSVTVASSGRRLSRALVLRGRLPPALLTLTDSLTAGLPSTSRSRPAAAGGHAGGRAPRTASQPANQPRSSPQR